MRFNKHPNLEGLHSFLSPSTSSWIRYDEEKLRERFYTKLAAQHGTRLHELAKELILLRQQLPETNQTLNAYVNDAIGFRMIPEQILYYSDNCFGTADAIKFTPRTMELRIADLKTGVIKAKMEQLETYTALFCLEYLVKPAELNINLRIYQNDEIDEYVPELDKIVHIMDQIKMSDKFVEELKAEVRQ